MVIDRCDAGLLAPGPRERERKVMERQRFRSDELRAARASRFAAQLADSLYALGVTHKDLAQALSVAPSTVDSWTRGADPKIPSEATFARLCTWLDAQAPGTGRKLAAA